MRQLAHVIEDAVLVQAERLRRFPWKVTVHAAEKYRDRVDPTMTVTAAWRVLERCLPAAELLPQPTTRGQSRWLLPGGNAVAVCKPDPKIKARVVVTVLGPNEMFEPEAEDEVVEAYERIFAPPPPLMPASKPLQKQPASPPAPREMVPIGLLADKERQLEAMTARYNNMRRARESLLADHVALKLKRLDVHAHHVAAVESVKKEVAKWKERALLAESNPQRALAAEAVAKRANAHAEKMESERESMRNMLRIAVRALRDGDCDRGLAALEAARPGITGDHFCFPKRFTKAERRAVMCAAEQNAGGGQ
jgi:hypothetical protein